MSSFRIVSRKNRLLIGVSAIAVVLTLFTIGFIIQKPRNYGPKLISVDIYKDASTDGLPFYEASPDENCVNVISEQVVSGKDQKNAKDVGETVNPLDAPLVGISGPKCKAASAFPDGYQKLGKDKFILLTLNINKEGKIEHGEIEKTSGIPELDEAALKQVTGSWSFDPCKKAGVVVACRQKIKFRWKS